MEANELEYFRNTNISKLPIRIIHIPIPIQSLVFPSGRPGFISYHAPLLRSMRNLQRAKPSLEACINSWRFTHE